MVLLIVVALARVQEFQPPIALKVRLLSKQFRQTFS